ncbi:hypothetical protein FIBSPDRAFT_952689 [Athelia psychrophila]|uniref:Uncharacterized protein n=1 Tax=Athelia psychrophila TaxID=1759441 RepID=A0A166L4N0_9AGAM|nr:hypothetical protein FIBSPDRAFT_952689 [Fibularhizoctonia sp. CBS 109695]
MIASLLTLTVAPLGSRTSPLSIKTTGGQTSCLDIDWCRTLAEIITPALTALVAAVYLTIHLNVPPPGRSTIFQNTLRAALITFITLMFPEWTCVWAVRNYIIASRLLPKLEEARKRAMDKWYDNVVDERTHERTPRAFRSSNHSHFRRDEEYTMVHAFFVLMGGLHIYNGTGHPIGPLTADDAVELIRCRLFLLPPLQKIEGLSKRSSLGKLSAFSGLLWFVIPCIVRFAQSLQMAAFEVTVLAHTSIAIITLVPWWSKPMNVDCPEPVAIKVFPRSRRDTLSLSRHQSFDSRFSCYHIAYAYIFGRQDALFDFGKIIYVPTFWSGDPDTIFMVPMSGTYAPKAPRSAYVTGAASSLLVAVIFGLIHCITWNYDLPSTIE